jgi:hypothetical protein
VELLSLPLSLARSNLRQQLHLLSSEAKKLSSHMLSCSNCNFSLSVPPISSLSHSCVPFIISPGGCRPVGETTKNQNPNFVKVLDGIKVMVCSPLTAGNGLPSLHSPVACGCGDQLYHARLKVCLQFSIFLIIQRRQEFFRKLRLKYF